MNKDRKEICKIISEMLDNPDEFGVYPTSICYEKLENYIDDARFKAIGWTHAWACLTDDIMSANAPDILKRYEIDCDKIEHE